MTWKKLSTSKSFFCYIGNSNQETSIEESAKKYNTNWHLIPNQRYGQVLHPRHWEQLMSRASRYRLVHQKVSIGHGVPLASIAAIGSNTGEIVAFNNTLPILIYQDNSHHTLYQVNTQFPEALEGETFTGSKHDAFVLQKYEVPKDNWEAGWKFEPLVHAEDVQILYPGNNGCEFNWHIQEGDSNKYVINHQNATNWIRASKDRTVNTIYKNTMIAHHKYDPSFPEHESVRWSSGKIHYSEGTIYRNPPPNILLKLEPIVAPSTNKPIIHYCKLFITIKCEWEYLPFNYSIPSSVIPKVSIKYLDKDNKTNTDTGYITQPLQNIIEEEDMRDTTNTPVKDMHNFMTPGGKSQLGDMTTTLEPSSNYSITQKRIYYSGSARQEPKKVKTDPEVIQLSLELSSQDTITQRPLPGLE
uniref:Structural protein VP n=1 Tax=Mops bat parvovirus TaxID=3141925 RepID=A0AAU7DZW0_9VIRU